MMIWELESGMLVHTMQTDAVDVWNVTFSPDGKYVATGSHTGNIVIYGIEKGKKECVLDTRGKFTCCVDWVSNIN